MQPSGPFAAVNASGPSSAGGFSLLFLLAGGFTGTAGIVLTVNEVPAAAAAAAAGWPPGLLPAAPLISLVAFNFTVEPLPSAPTLPGYAPGPGAGPTLYVEMAIPNATAAAAAAGGGGRRLASPDGTVLGGGPPGSEARLLEGALRAAQSAYEAAEWPAVYGVANVTGGELAAGLAVDGNGSLVRRPAPPRRRLRPRVFRGRVPVAEAADGAGWRVEGVQWLPGAPLLRPAVLGAPGQR